MNKTILILEDERALRFAIETSLKKNGFSVLSSSNVEDAVEILKKYSKIDAIWLDHYLLGNKNGIDFMYELKQNQEWAKVPVFVVTNSVSDDKISTYKVLGIEKYFVKSNCSLSSIIDTVKKTIN